MSLFVGGIALNFSAPDQTGKIHRLSDYRGKWLLLYFYPKDHTPGCIREACNFRDHYAELSKHLAILGISGDSVASHVSFADKYKLPFPLLADPQKQIIKAYGTDGIILAKRTSFFISPGGKIVKIYESVNPDSHITDILADIRQLRT